MAESSPYEKNEVSVRELGTAVRKRWWFPLAGLLLGLLLALGFSMTQVPQYQSVTTALVHATSPEDTATDQLAAEELAKSRAVTYESLGNSVVVADAVKHDLGLEASAQDLLDSVRVVANPDTTGLEITAKSDSPEQARDLAAAWRDALSDAAGDPEGGDKIEVVPAGEPTFSDTPIGISTPLIYAIGGSVGLFLGIIAAVAFGRSGERD